LGLSCLASAFSTASRRYSTSIGAGLPHQREFKRTVDHRFALGMPGLPTALPKKLLTPGRPVEKLRLPARDLVPMNDEKPKNCVSRP
jgi:hypothetical protein